MFDMLTDDQLFRLHDSLFRQGTAVHQRMMTEDGRPRISVFSRDWDAMAAHHAELSETQFAVAAELHRRAEEARADA